MYSGKDVERPLEKDILHFMLTLSICGLSVGPILPLV